jgi:2-polyprenyl-3-methyl-5-hydroxy-6-metoxy-1,4-benzoquinol methylase
MPESQSNDLFLYRHKLYETYAKSHIKKGDVSKTINIKSRAPYIRNIIKKHVPSNKSCSIIDIGCGHGAFFYYLKEYGYTTVSGVEYSQDQIEEARSLGLSCIEKGDALRYVQNCPSESFDVILTIDLLEHFSKNENLLFAEQVLRILKPGGRWIIHVPNGGSPFGTRVFSGDLTHETLFSAGSLSQLIHTVGFSKTRFFEDKPLIYSLSSLTRRILWEGMRIGLSIYLFSESGILSKDTVFSQNILAVVER